MTEFIYRCTLCRREFKRDRVRYLCSECSKKYTPGKPLPGVLTVVFDYSWIKKQYSVKKPNWTLFSAVEEEFYPSYPVGNTPFFRAPILGKELGFVNLWIKNDGANPSGSLKDRASFLIVAEANRLKEKKIVAASTGNAASALAAVAASADKQAIIFVPENAPRAKLAQMVLHGAKVIPVQGTYDDAFSLSLQYTEKMGGLNRNTAYHPLTIEGKKTVGLEIFEQNNYQVPDCILIPVGDGVIISGVYKAFFDLKEAGVISSLPRLVCVQAEHSSAIHNFVQTGKYENADDPLTIADSISVSAPSNAYLARKAIVGSEGFSITVSDNEILAGQKLLASRTGIFAEPAAAATVAGLQKMRDLNHVNKDDQIVLLITGHGLKDIESAMRNIQIPEAIKPAIENVPEM